ncbi:hypothetical protein H8M03_09765 [Sphingomonas sabuli]|uniref:Uncharacterized protein n=1 Tax=Sphingomonas sabuli TaxID=2764186 RepID=A0A7G9L0Z9_9SPHN|nr:hypothetical protein [Sphingomonas sabuli]QNM82298.1 hypothetical protein H8M03_09765 [Sphingomonas sabuli]
MMKTFSYFASLVAAASLAAPAAAQPRMAGFDGTADSSRTQSFLFSGATMHLSLGGKTAARPEFALRVAGATRTAGTAPRIGDGVAFSAVPGATPRMTLAGQDSKALDKRLRMSGGTTALVVGGVVVAALLVVAVAGGAGDAAAAAWDED